MLGDSNSLEYSLSELLDACEEAGKDVNQMRLNFSDGHSPTSELPLDFSPENKENQHLLETDDETGTGSINSSLEYTEYPGDLQGTRQRKRRKDPKAWQFNINMAKRMHGEEYLGSVTTKNNNNKLKTGIVKPQRVMGHRCISKMCASSKQRQCKLFNERDRLEIFNQFWKSWDWKQKRLNVSALVDAKPKSRKTAGENSKRSMTYKYFLKLRGERTQVCQKMFMNTLGLNRRQVLNWLTGKSFKSTNKKALANSVNAEKRKYAVKFINDLPKLPSHYCRNSTSKLYLEPIYGSQRGLHREYEKNCKVNKMPAVCRYTFDAILEENNVGLFHPKKDECDVCVQYRVGNLPKEAWDEHIEKKESARREKEKDKLKAKMTGCHVLTMDTQAVLMSPMLNASALYYKTKLVVHNFTMYDLVTKSVKCFLWDESEGGLESSVFASCILSYLEDLKDDKPIILYSDGCTCQNRNVMLSTALLDYAIRFKKTVVQKYLEKGHTQMEVDSVHSAIERKLRRKTIYIPTDYINVCETARNDPFPYQVKYMKHTDFLNFSIRENQRYSSIRPGKNKTGEPVVTDIRQLKYAPNGVIQYKLNHGDDWRNIPRQPQNVTKNFPKLYSANQSIMERKFKDLMDLLHVIPPEFHDFYKSLLHK